jgi:hypothetical protein
MTVRFVTMARVLCLAGLLARMLEASGPFSAAGGCAITNVIPSKLAPPGRVQRLLQIFNKGFESGDMFFVFKSSRTSYGQFAMASPNQRGRT